VCATLELLLSGCATGSATAPSAASTSPAGWTEWKLPGKRSTDYTASQQAGRDCIRADSQASASMLRRGLRVEPGQLGKVRFTWRVNDLIANADLTDRDAEDSPVRVVLAFDGDHARLTARNRMMFDLAHAVTGETPPYATLMYVWDNHAPLETVIHGGRTDRIRKFVVETGPSQLGVWREHERDIAADFRKAFGEEPGPLIGIALMTDSDNTGSSAQAHYCDIQLVPALAGPTP
jgi:hypothetical protein